MQFSEREYLRRQSEVQKNVILVRAKRNKYNYVIHSSQLLCIFAVTNRFTMKKEFGKWLMDIAKYVTTAVLLSSWFSEVNDWEWYTYVLVVVSVVLTLAIGLSFVRDEEETIQSNKNKKGR